MLSGGYHALPTSYTWKKTNSYLIIGLRVFHRHFWKGPVWQGGDETERWHERRSETSTQSEYH